MIEMLWDLSLLEELSSKCISTVEGFETLLWLKKAPPPCTDNTDNSRNPVRRIIGRRNQTNKESLKKAVNHIYNTFGTDFCGLPLYGVTYLRYK